MSLCNGSIYKLSYPEWSIIAQENGDIVIIHKNEQVRIESKDFNEFLKGRVDILCQKKQQK